MKEEKREGEKAEDKIRRGGEVEGERGRRGKRRRRMLGVGGGGVKHCQTSFLPLSFRPIRFPTYATS